MLWTYTKCLQKNLNNYIYIYGIESLFFRSLI